MSKKKVKQKKNFNSNVKSTWKQGILQYDKIDFFDKIHNCFASIASVSEREWAIS